MSSSNKASRLSSRVKGADGQAISYNAERIIGNGSFGVVFQATVVQTGEIVAIKKAAKKVKNYRFDDMYLFTTLEPCLMCASIILNARFKRVYFFIEDQKSGALVNNHKLISCFM